MRASARVFSASVMALILTGCGSRSYVEQWRLGWTESFTLRSSATQSEFQIMVALPREYETSGVRYPALYVLDGNATFPIVVETARFLEFDRLQQVPVVVGVGYPVALFWNSLGPRVKDFTPTADPDFVENLSARFGFPPRGSGGAAEFLRFLADDLFPVIENRYRVDARDRALYGYSLAGLFATYALFQRPELFGSYIIGAPSLWWDNGVLWEYERELARSATHLPGRALFVVGELDAPHVKIVEDLDEVLRSRAYRGLHWEIQVLDQETHNSAIPATISRGLRWLYGDMAAVSDPRAR
jgi:uncharacterized protein